MKPHSSDDLTILQYNDIFYFTLKFIIYYISNLQKGHSEATSCV